jgi:hypothetical protein
MVNRVARIRGSSPFQLTKHSGMASREEERRQIALPAVSSIGTRAGR